MFYNCSNITEIDLSNFDFSNIIDMSHIFSECTSLKRIEFGDINTQNVVDMSYMFYNCTSLDSLELSGFHISKVENMEYMFFNCISLIYIGFPYYFQESKVKLMNSIFYNCSNLTSIDIHFFKSPSLEDMSYMFSGCSSLQSLNLLNFDTSKVINMSYLFNGCHNLESLKLLKFNTLNVISTSYMFSDCQKITSLNLSHFDTRNITDMSGMFMGCITLKSLDIPNFHSQKVELMDNMFSHCNSLTSLNIRNFDFSKVSSSKYMFSGCNNLTFINLGRGILGNDNTNIFSSIENNINNITLCIKKDVNTRDLNNFNIINSCHEECNEYHFFDINEDKCTKYCSINDLFNNLCEFNVNKEESIDDFIYDYIKMNISNLSISLLKNNSYLEIKGKHATFKITDDIDKINNNSANKRYRNLDSCSIILKNKYNISNNDDLIILIIDIISQDSKKNQKRVYEFYNIDKNKENNPTKLDAGICQDIIKNDISENCSSYSIESLVNDSCLNCKDYYYPIYESDINDPKFIKCYKDLEGYYFNNSINKYQQCYETCKSCEKSGDNSAHNCNKCNNNYPFKYENNCYKFCHNNTYDESTDVYECLEEPKCLDKKLFPENSSCVDDCSNTKNKFEFNKTCYNECPTGTSPSEKNKYLCEIKCPKEKPYENLINHQCMEKCGINDRFNNKCKLNYISSETKDKDLSEKITENILHGEMKEVISDVLKSKKTVVIENGEEAHLISALSSNLKRTDFSSIDFGSCEELIKNANGINKDEELLLYEVEHNIEGFNIPIIEYVLFNEDCTKKLNLDACNNVKIQYYIPIKINEEELDKHDPSSDFYNKECNKETSLDGVDMPQYVKKDIYNKDYMSLCEKGCTFKGLDSNREKIVCDCNLKSDMTYNSDNVNKDDLLDKMENEKRSSNLGVTNCLGEVFNSPKRLITNSGFIILTIILGIFIIAFIIFCTKEKSNLENKINEEIYNKFEKKPKKSKTNNNIDNNKIKDDINPGTKPKKKRKKSKASNLRKNSVSIKSSKIPFVNILPGEKNNLGLIDNNNNKMSMKYKLTTNENNINNKIEDKPNQNNDYEMNNLDYIQAIKYDKRTCCDYYWSLLKNKQLFLFTFCSFNDYNSGIIKKFIFFLSFAIHYTISALFFDDENMLQIYEDKGKYNISYQMPNIILSALFSNILLRLMLETLILTDRSVLYVKHQYTRQSAETAKEKILKCVNVKFTIFFIANFILLILFWFYLVSFNGIYENTQIYLIENTFIAFAFSLAYPFFWNIIPTAFRMSSLGTKNPEKRCLYMASKICQLI